VDRVEKKGAGTRLAGGGDDDVRNAERAAAAVALAEVGGGASGVSASRLGPESRYLSARKAEMTRLS